jgi:hypothetical protein
MRLSSWTTGQVLSQESAGMFQKRESCELQNEAIRIFRQFRRLSNDATGIQSTPITLNLDRAIRCVSHEAHQRR